MWEYTLMEQGGLGPSLGQAGFKVKHCNRKPFCLCYGAIVGSGRAGNKEACGPPLEVLLNSSHFVPSLGAALLGLLRKAHSGQLRFQCPVVGNGRTGSVQGEALATLGN